LALPSDANGLSAIGELNTAGENGVGVTGINRALVAASAIPVMGAGELILSLLVFEPKMDEAPNPDFELPPLARTADPDPDPDF
jgi:hypothetical protein